MKDTVVDFSDLAEEIITGPVFGSENLLISGGSIFHQELGAFLQAWDFPSRAMPYAIWEYMSRIDFVVDERIDNYDEFVRGRGFGPGGDLSLRRSGDLVFWSFIGPRNAPIIDGYASDLYWKTHEGEKFYRLPRRYLLWGSRGPGEDQWVDPRVGQADLRYPLAYPGDGVYRPYVKAWEFTRSGRVEFVWFTGLELVKEEA